MEVSSLTRLPSSSHHSPTASFIQQTPPSHSPSSAASSFPATSPASAPSTSSLTPLETQPRPYPHSHHSRMSRMRHLHRLPSPAHSQITTIHLSTPIPSYTSPSSSPISTSQAQDIVVADSDAESSNVIVVAFTQNPSDSSDHHLSLSVS